MRLRLFGLVVILALFVQGVDFAQAEDATYWINLGDEYYNQGDNVKAIECFLEAKNIQEKTLGKEHPDYAELLNDLGYLYKSMGDYTNTEGYYLEAKAIWERALGKEHPDYALSLNNLGALYDTLGDYARAEGYYLEAKAIWEKALGKGHPNYAASLNNLGMLYRNMGNYIGAEGYFIEAKDIWEMVLGKEHPSYAISVNNLGYLYSSMGDYARAEVYYLEAKDIREKVLGKENPNYAASLNNLGALYRNMGDYTGAEGYNLEAKEIRERVLGKEHSDYAASLNNLGAVYNSLGDYARAEGYYLEAKGIMERALREGHPSYAISLNNLGVLYRNIGDYARAEGYYLEAKDIRERALGKGHPSYATSLDSLGSLYATMGDYAKAEGYFLEAKDIRERALGKGHPDYAGTLNNLGLLYHNMNDYAGAERYFLEAKDIFDMTLGKRHPSYAISLNNLGLLYFGIGDYARAERYYLEAKGIIEKALGKEYSYYVNSLDNMFALYLSTRKFTHVITFKQESNQLNIGQVNRNFSFLSEQQRNAYWNANAYSFELSYSLSWYYPVPESNVLNYDNALFSKGLLLRTTNAVRDSIYSSGDHALIAQFEDLGRLRQQINALIQSEDRNEAYIQSLEVRAEALDKSLTQASVAFREFQADLGLGWQDVRDSLLTNEAAIEFVSFRVYDKGWTGTTQYAALVLRPGMGAPVWVPLCEEDVLAQIFSRIERFSRLGPQEQTRQLYDDYGPALYNAIWQPLEKPLEGVSTVYYSPSGLLHKIAFNAIPVGDSRLMDVYDLNLLSSTREVVYRNSMTSQTPASAVIYGGLVYDMDAESMRQEALAFVIPETGNRQAALPAELRGGNRNGWDYLDGAELERIMVQQMLNTNKIPNAVYSGVSGNEESFKDLNGKKTAVIHLATHGFFIQDIEKKDAERELLQRVGGGERGFENPLLRSGLILSGGNNAWINRSVPGIEDGILFADEVARLNLLGTELVVLSACETGLGEVNNSEGVFGLQRAFKLAGAQTLVMSLWKVSDEATKILMENFYQSWLSGISKQDAMKEAQRMLRADSRYSSPFYWAAFVVMD